MNLKETLVNSDMPTSIVVEMTNICSANCSFCGYGKKADPRPKGKVSWEVLHKLGDMVDKLDKPTTFSPLTILGDPLCHDEWIETIRFFSTLKGVGHLRAYTNAILLHKVDTTELLNSGLKLLCISTDLQSKETYRKHYGVDRYDTVIQNIVNLCRKNDEMGSPLTVQIMLRSNLPIDHLYENPIYEELGKYIKPQGFTHLEIYDDFNGTVSANDIPEGATFRELEGKRELPCYALYRSLVVLYDGTLQLCSCRIVDQLQGDNIMNHDSIQSAWKSPALEEMRKSWWEGKTPSYCMRCSHYLPYTTLKKYYEKHSFFTLVKNKIKYEFSKKIR